MATEGVRGPGLGTGVKRPAPAALHAVPRPEPWPLLPSSVKWRRALQAFLRGRRRTQHSWDSFSCLLCSWLQALFLVPSGRSPDAEVTSPAKPSPRCEPSGLLQAFLDTLPVTPSHTWARVPLHAVKTGPREGTCHGSCGLTAVPVPLSEPLCSFLLASGHVTAREDDCFIVPYPGHGCKSGNKLIWAPRALAKEKRELLKVREDPKVLACCPGISLCSGFALHTALRSAVGWSRAPQTWCVSGPPPKPLAQSLRLLFPGSHNSRSHVPPPGEPQKYQCWAWARSSGSLQERGQSFSAAALPWVGNKSATTRSALRDTPGQADSPSPPAGRPSP